MDAAGHEGAAGEGAGQGGAKEDAAGPGSAEGGDAGPGGPQRQGAATGDTGGGAAGGVVGPGAEDLAAVARRYALQNAVQHGGRADAKSALGRILGGHEELRPRAAEVRAALEEACAAVNAMDAAAQRAELEAVAPELVERQVKKKRDGIRPLPNATGKVVLRFAPNPNGPLSLGHARGVVLLGEYARMHDAAVVLRFDDTDPQVKPPLYDPAQGVDAYAMITEEWTWLAGRAPDRIVKASDRIPAYHDAARDLIRAGGAYVCTCDADAWRAMKESGHPCPHRGIAPGPLLEAFEKMVEGGFAPGTAVLRVKTDIQHKDPALRDWTAMRVVRTDAVHPREAVGEIPHHACWPLLDFESAVEDHQQGVTHIIRGKDLMDSTKKQRFLYEHLGWTYPETLYWGRVRVHGFGRFSTSWMRRKIEEGVFTGWDDPRLPTLRALRRRGYRAEALRRFWVGLGLTEKDIAVSMENLDAENQKEVEAADRFFFVPDPHPLSVTGLDGRVARPLLHPEDPARGRRELATSHTVLIPGAERGHRQVRLKDLGNVVVMGGTGMWTGDTMDRSIPILQWLPKEQAAPFTVLVPGTMEEAQAQAGAAGKDPAAGVAADGAGGDGRRGVLSGDAVAEPLVPPLHEVKGVAEPGILAKVGEVVQFERFGFVRIETPERGVWLHA